MLLHAGAQGETSMIPQSVLDAISEALNESKQLGLPAQVVLTAEPDGSIEVRRLAVLPPAGKLTLVSEEGRARLEQALSEARKRGDNRLAAILDGPEMLTAQQMAELLRATPEKVEEMRLSGELLSLSGAGKGRRFPKWQIGDDGKPFPELAKLHEILTTPFAVYRFLLQHHPELGGDDALSWIQAGRGNKVFEAAENSLTGFA